MRIGIDIMGGETSPDELFTAITNYCAQFPEKLQFRVFLTKCAAHSIQSPPPTSLIELCICNESIEPCEVPLYAIRQKPNSTIIRGIHEVKHKTIDAFISCGNTGALIAASTLYLPKCPGVKRLALLTKLPSLHGHFVILDVGSNVIIKKEQILCQAFLGASYCYKQTGKAPRIGFLNIGTEDSKGTLLHQKIHFYLKENLHSSSSLPLDYIGNVEAMDAFEGKVDVVVTDGFTGNIFLKTAEAASDLIFTFLENSLPSTSSQDLSNAKKKFDFTEQPGAFIAGIERLVVKCHGRSTVNSLEQAIFGITKEWQK